jgi:DNA-directed RNA polymerase specialized sigma subunit
MKSPHDNYEDISSYLKRYKYSKSTIENLQKEIQFMTGLKFNCTSVLSDMPHSQNQTDGKDKLIMIMRKIEFMQRDYENEVLFFLGLKKEIEKMICSLEQLFWQTILWDIYISDLSFNEIAIKENCSTKTVSRVHNLALNKLNKQKKP